VTGTWLSEVQLTVRGTAKAGKLTEYITNNMPSHTTQYKQL